MAQTRAGVLHETHAAPVDEDLARLRGMLEQGDVEGARAFVKVLDGLWPDSASVRHYARVLAPPVARVVPGHNARRLDREHAWLKEHASEYPGCWLAVLGDQLVAADPSFSAVLAAVREIPGANTALFHYQFASRTAGDTEL